MSGKWFSNRGQMIQVTCAVLAVLIGIAAQWSQLSIAINFGEILKVLLYPVAVVIGFQLGTRALNPTAQTAAAVEPSPPLPQPTIEASPTAAAKRRFTRYTLNPGSRVRL